MAGDEQLRQQRAGLHHEVDGAEDPHLLGAVGKQPGHQSRLFEIQEGAGSGQQQHEGGDSQQVARTQHPRQSAERVARHGAARAFRPLGTGPPGAGHVPPGHQVMLEHHRQGQQQRRQQHQPELPEHTHQQRARGGPDQAADTGARGDEGEQPTRLGRIEYVGHQAPGHRHHEQVVDRDPHIEHPRQPDAVAQAEEQPGEQQQVGAEEAVDPIDVMDARHPRVEPGEQRYRHQHGDEGRAEQPLQVLHAALDAHGLADRPQHEVAAEQAEEQPEAGQCRTQLGGTGVDQRGQAQAMLAHGTGSTEGVDDQLALPRIRQAALPCQQVVGHVARRRGGGDHRRHRRIGEDELEQQLCPGRGIDLGSPVR